MRLVIADTGPINYLILIGHVDLLPRLFERVALPRAMERELYDMDAPDMVRRWIVSPPPWLEIHEIGGLPRLPGLDEGETAAIALAESLHAELLLIDERNGYRAAKGRGLRVTGTLGVLDMAADHALLDFAGAIQKLRDTNFRRPEALLGTLLKKHRGDGGA